MIQQTVIMQVFSSARSSVYFAYFIYVYDQLNVVKIIEQDGGMEMQNISIKYKNMRKCKHDGNDIN